MEETGKNADILEGEQARNWWKLPFDSTTNFSLFGYFLGGLRWEDPRNRTDFTLENE
ncbi:MAG TPA: hypothetical protein VJM57_09330 [Thermodesulfobacteriota bacterium]|nr:hypothetical protein [Thermodesulfobacteriota bacterium]